MQLAPAQLAAHLQRGLRPLYTLHGDEPLLVQEAADAIRTVAREQGHTERTVHTVAGAHFDWSAVLAAGGSLSLFADKQLIEIRIPSGKPGKDGSAALQQVAEGAAANEGTLTLVLLPRLDFATRKSAWFAALDGHGATLEFQAVERNALPQWITQRLARNVDAGEVDSWVGLGVAGRDCAPQGSGEGATAAELAEEIAECSGRTALDGENVVACLDEFSQRVDHREAGAHRCFVEDVTAVRLRRVLQLHGGVARSERNLVGEHEIPPSGQREIEDRAGVGGGHIHEDRTRQGVRRHYLDRLDGILDQIGQRLADLAAVAHQRAVLGDGGVEMEVDRRMRDLMQEQRLAGDADDRFTAEHRLRHACEG